MNDTNKTERTMRAIFIIALILAFISILIGCRSQKGLYLPGHKYTDTAYAIKYRVYACKLIDAEILSIQVQAKKMCLWAKVSSTLPKAKRTIYIYYGAGTEIEKDNLYKMGSMFGTFLLINHESKTT